MKKLFKLKIDGGWVIKKAYTIGQAICEVVKELSKYFVPKKIFAIWMEDGKACCKGLII